MNTIMPSTSCKACLAKNLKRAVLIDNNGQTYLSIGYRDNRYWPSFPSNNSFRSNLL